MEALRRSGARIAHTSQSHATVTPAATDLVVLADYLVADPRMVRDLHSQGVPHLPVRVRDGTGLVGPLVIPGKTSCLSQSLSGNTWPDYHRCPAERWDQQYAHAVPETSYASCGDLSLAYQVFGDGPVELVFVGPIVSHVELYWTMPEFKAFFEQLATFCRVLLFDKAGVGLSDPVPKVRLLEERAAEIEAVMDAVGFGKPALFGMSEGGPAAIVFAAKRPERTRALILYGSSSCLPGAGWDDLERDPAELRARARSRAG